MYIIWISFTIKYIVIIPMCLMGSHFCVIIYTVKCNSGSWTVHKNWGTNVGSCNNVHEVDTKTLLCRLSEMKFEVVSLKGDCVWITKHSRVNFMWDSSHPQTMTAWVCLYLIDLLECLVGFVSIDSMPDVSRVSFSRLTWWSQENVDGYCCCIPGRCRKVAEAWS